MRLKQGDIIGIILEEIEHQRLQRLAQLVHARGQQHGGPVRGIHGCNGVDGEEARGVGVGFEDVARRAGGHFAGVAGAEEGRALGGG